MKLAYRGYRFILSVVGLQEEAPTIEDHRHHGAFKRDTVAVDYDGLAVHNECCAYGSYKVDNHEDRGKGHGCAPL